MTDKTTPPTAEELRQRKAQLADQLQKAHAEEQERTDAIGRENAELLAAGKALPDASQAELEKLRGHIRALLAAIEQTNLQILETEERERVSGAVQTRATAVVPSLARANQHAAAVAQILPQLAEHFIAWRYALVEALSKMPRRQVADTVRIDSSWKERLSNAQAKHVLSCALMNHLGAFFEYDQMPINGWKSDMAMESRDLAASMLRFFDDVHGLTQFGLPGVPMADGELDPGVERIGNPRFHGAYAGSKQTVEGAEWK